MKKSAISILIVSSLLAFITACNTQKTIEGKWQSKLSNTFLEFTDNRVLKVEMVDLGMKFDGTYAFVDNNTVRITAYLLGDYLYDISINDDTLTLKRLEDGISVEFIRVKNGIIMFYTPIAPGPLR